MGKRGERLKSPGIRYLVEHYAYDARLEQVTPHPLRHTFGKNLVEAGVPLDRVAGLLGHESVDTTRIYTTPSAQDLRQEVEKVAMAGARGGDIEQSSRASIRFVQNTHSLAQPLDCVR
jgi:integrase/recombinase XerC